MLKAIIDAVSQKLVMVIMIALLLRDCIIVAFQQNERDDHESKAKTGGEDGPMICHRACASGNLRYSYCAILDSQNQSRILSGKRSAPIQRLTGK